MKPTLRIVIGLLVLLWGMSPARTGRGSETGAPGEEDTWLMFVGEDLEVLTIASRRQESAWQAPAVAQVITRGEIQERGIETLAQALAMTPGFYMAQKEWGTQPYLRGIPDSVLLLYDTVPLISDTRKSVHPLDHDLSLSPVKRIEIIRGPGSVLWGPDAFAGIVNVVPMTGRDLDGGEAWVLYESPGEHGAAALNLGRERGGWDMFLSLSAREGEEDERRADLVRFFGDGMPPPVAPEERAGSRFAGRSRYMEASGRIAYRDWFTLSGRIADNRRPYTLTRAEEDLTWREARSTPQSFLKLEAQQALGRSSALRFTGYYSLLELENRIIDLSFDSQESTGYAELILDRSLRAGGSLLTLGASYREKHIKNAPIWDAYLPDFLGPENRLFLPTLRQEDYDTRLWSFFGQYSHKIGDVDLWVGLRFDEHDKYEDHLSYNAGLLWSFAPRWVFKTLYGTAYRTPFARQLLGEPAFTPEKVQAADEPKPELERIETVSLQLAWKPAPKTSVSLTGFLSRIENHIMEDPFAGLSLPNEQEVRGLELEGTWTPLDPLSVSGNLTLLDNRGPKETYEFFKFFKPDPEGGFVPVFEQLTYPYDAGADTLFNLTGTWRPHDRLTAFARLGYFSSRDLIFPRGETGMSHPGAWLLDGSLTFHDLWQPGLELQVSARNVADVNYETPGTYGSISGDPFSVFLLLRKRW